MKPSKFGRGRQPYDTLIGLKVGALTGALLGALLAALTNLGPAWTVVAGTILGAVAGYVWEKRQIDRE